MNERVKHHTVRTYGNWFLIINPNGLPVYELEPEGFEPILKFRDEDEADACAANLDKLLADEIEAEQTHDES